MQKKQCKYELLTTGNSILMLYL